MADTLKASWITDHAFEPRTKAVAVRSYHTGMVRLPENPYLCGFEYGHRWGEYHVATCNLGEAAHRETTIERNP